jgi:predicted TIM-barrel fold metal-dependent hydrolase
MPQSLSSPSSNGLINSSEEAILDGARVIVDPHHHLWDRGALIRPLPPSPHPFEVMLSETPRYMMDELLADVGCGHKVVATVYVECGSMYRSDGPAQMRCVGETEFVNGVAAMSSSGTYGEARLCAGIVGHADLTRGEAVREVLEAHIQAGGGRFRGIRHAAAYDADPAVLGPLVRAPKGLYRDPVFREGYRALGALGLSFDAWLLEPQLEDLIDLAKANPSVPVVLDHVGTPLGIGAYAGKRQERFQVWAEAIRRLAALENVVVKVGGLAMPFAAFPPDEGEGDTLSARLAAHWRPYVETCVEAFGPKRSMFESNFPVDRITCSYRVLWNALKTIALSWSEADKQAVFSETARRVYRLDI